jgi:hypothetical protein
LAVHSPSPYTFDWSILIGIQTFDWFGRIHRFYWIHRFLFYIFIKIFFSIYRVKITLRLTFNIFSLAVVIYNHLMINFYLYIVWITILQSEILDLKNAFSLTRFTISTVILGKMCIIKDLTVFRHKLFNKFGLMISLICLNVFLSQMI